MLSLASKRKRFEVDMTPLIDVVFLLLIFFMLTFAIQGQGMALSLPEGEENRQENAIKDLIVTIGINGNLKLNDQAIQIDSLKDTLATELQNRDNKLVIIDSAPKVKYGLFAKVLDVSRDAGAENFSIIK
ncbi:MAG: biopolymer transporter ExbD [Nitrospinae bacterium]|nr:biopolymer transporter ExbD [Nitrospinota bacterium]MZH40345.1 biopolymer transporter ExbD [Nitrospinota bacterium]